MINYFMLLITQLPNNLMTVLLLLSSFSISIKNLHSTFYTLHLLSSVTQTSVHSSRFLVPTVPGHRLSGIFVSVLLPTSYFLLPTGIRDAVECAYA